MSFFDEADEPSRTEVRSSSGPAARRRPRRTGGSQGSGSGSSGRRRPPGGQAQQSILARRAVAVIAVIIVVVLIAVGVNSCEGSARKNALRDYAGDVSALITRSDNTSNSLFRALTGGSSDSTEISQSVNQTRATAEGVLTSAQRLSVPSAAKTAQTHLILALQMRLDGITTIAKQIQAALGNSVRNSAVTNLASQMARFYASDVVYKEYTAPELVSALHANSIGVGGTNGAPVNPGQFLPGVQWLTPSYVASRLGVTLSATGGSSSSAKNGTGGLRGHNLTSVASDGTTLTADATATIAASPAPTFTLDFANGGNFDEYDVTCQVQVNGTSDAGTKVVPETFAGKSATCNVTLSKPPPKGTYTIKATVEKVPGEANLANNTLSYTVDFN